MGMLTEPEIYMRCKEILIENGWIILGGEPPDGTDNIPRIQLKEESYYGIGSKGSKKIDLVAVKGDRMLLLELKGKYNSSDIKKLNEIASSEKWIKALGIALDDKNVYSIAKTKRLKITKGILVKSIGVSAKHSFPEDFVIPVSDNQAYKQFGNSVAVPVIKVLAKAIVKSLRKGK